MIRSFLMDSSAAGTIDEKHARRFRVRPVRKKRAAAACRNRQAACNRARPNGVLEKLAALTGEGMCARLRLGVPADALFSSCAFLSVVAVLDLTREACYAPAWRLAMGCSPHVQSRESGLLRGGPDAGWWGNRGATEKTGSAAGHSCDRPGFDPVGSAPRGRPRSPANGSQVAVAHQPLTLFIPETEGE